LENRGTPAAVIRYRGLEAALEDARAGVRDDGARARPARRRAAALGFFDGLHVGHQRLLAELRGWAGELGLEPAVVTFERHPQEVLSESPPPAILSLEHRLLLLERAGVSAALVLAFDRDMARWTPEELVRRVFVEALGARHVLMGFDSAFGHRRLGTWEYLALRAAALGIELRQAGIERLGGERVSSTLVRQAVLAGDLPRLEALLGRRFALLGRVVRGDGRGRTIGFPTANLDVEGAALLPAGVYFARALHRGRELAAVVNIGRRPTVAREEGREKGREESAAAVVEAHLLDFEGDLYGERLELELLARRRDERKFASVEDLARAIRADVEARRRLPPG
jgi:riboflavin kinase/FMN adenylyltransferase